jgi:hypothetical protein
MYLLIPPLAGLRFLDRFDALSLNLIWNFEATSSTCRLIRFFLDKSQGTAYKMIMWLLYSYIVANMLSKADRSRPLSWADGH